MKNACVVGYGAIGPIHAAGIEKASNVNLYGICDINKTRAEKGAKEYACKAYFNFEDVINDPKIDSVHICTPHFLHDTMALLAMRAGKDVVLEKPVAVDLKRMEEVMRCANGKKVCVMLQNRMNTAVLEFKRLIEEDRTLGKLIGGFASVTWHRDKEYYMSGEWRGKWATEGGGLLINQAIHLIDLISYLAGDIKSVKGNISNKTLSEIIEVEDTADAIFYLENGVNVCFYATNGYVSSLPVRLELQFENAVLRYADDMLCRIDENGIKVEAKNGDKYTGKKYWGDSHAVVINNFYNGGCYPTLNDAENAMKALFKFYESARNNAEEVII